MNAQEPIPVDIALQFRKLLEGLIPVPDLLWQIFPMFTSYRSFEEGEIIREVDLINPNAYFLAEGICRSFVSVYDKEITISFYEKGNIFTSFTTDFERTETVNFFQFLESSKVIIIRYKELTELVRQHSEIEKYYRIIIENQIVNKCRDIKYHMKYNATEKYLRLMEDKPELIRRIPQKYIASYLGVTPQSLSRIRKGIQH